MSSGGLARIRRKTKYRTTYTGRIRKKRFRLYIGALTLIAGVGIIIVSLIKHFQ